MSTTHTNMSDFHGAHAVSAVDDLNEDLRNAHRSDADDTTTITAVVAAIGHAGSGIIHGLLAVAAAIEDRGHRDGRDDELLTAAAEELRASEASSREDQAIAHLQAGLGHVLRQADRATR